MIMGGKDRMELGNMKKETGQNESGVPNLDSGRLLTKINDA